MDGSEKRQAERAAITLRVDYKRLNTFFADYTRNISKGGTFIKTTKPLEVGTEFVFVLSVPATVGKPPAQSTQPEPESPVGTQIKLRGKVIWVTTVDGKSTAGASDDKVPGMGIRFLFHDDSERDAIDDVVEKLMDEALGEHISGKLLARKGDGTA
jgi:type IV pilus assembly protein PilZ